jgi:ubiquinone/menaquinone biosynthesis C-methylase UbiE
MVRNFLRNCRKPQGRMGRFVVKAMNIGHSGISEWGLSHLREAKYEHILDIGCGGGANIERLLKRYVSSRVDGIDYSEVSVEISCRKNARMLGKRCAIREGDVGALPYDNETFDLITAFETVYFWPDITNSIREVRRVLRDGGLFLICNDASDPTDKTWTSRIEGMRVYGKDELTDILLNNGFSDIHCDINEKGWLCVTAAAIEENEGELS